MREDVSALLRTEKVHPGRVARRNLDGAGELLEDDDEVELVLLGELSLVHELVPLPERARGALLLTRRGVAAYGSNWGSSLTCSGAWDEVTTFKARGGLGGVQVDAVIAGTRIQFFEVYAGKRSDDHSRAITRICGEHIGEGASS